MRLHLSLATCPFPPSIIAAGGARSILHAFAFHIHIRLKWHNGIDPPTCLHYVRRVGYLARSESGVAQWRSKIVHVRTTSLHSLVLTSLSRRRAGIGRVEGSGALQAIQVAKGNGKSKFDPLYRTDA